MQEMNELPLSIPVIYNIQWPLVPRLRLQEGSHGNYITNKAVSKREALVDYFDSYALVEIWLLVILPTLTVNKISKEK